MNPRKHRNNLPEPPQEPLYIDPEGVVRFRGNAIVMRLFREDRININEIAQWDVPIEDIEQFWQLLNYSTGGYGELSFIRSEVVERCDALAEEMLKKSGKWRGVK